MFNDICRNWLFCTWLDYYYGATVGYGICFPLINGKRTRNYYGHLWLLIK